MINNEANILKWIVIQLNNMVFVYLNDEEVHLYDTGNQKNSL